MVNKEAKGQGSPREAVILSYWSVHWDWPGGGKERGGAAGAFGGRAVARSSQSSVPGSVRLSTPYDTSVQGNRTEDLQ
ncbi:hypothetical protein AOLI_G00283990 [Acnodon oligacanthus]